MIRNPPPRVLLERVVLESSADDDTVSQTVLEAGVDYTIEVEGTYSVWPARSWESVCVGTTEPRPQFASPSRTGAVGLDPAYAFAAPSGTVICDRGAPSERSGWLYRTRVAADWTLAPTDAAYNPDHVYTTTVRGEGEALRVLIREVDDFGDNYGQFRLSIYGPAPR